MPLIFQHFGQLNSITEVFITHARDYKNGCLEHKLTNKVFICRMLNPVMHSSCHLWPKVEQRIETIKSTQGVLSWIYTYKFIC